MAKKSLGQHWLQDEQALQQIVAAAELKSSDNVLEVGPGKGVLTRALADTKANVTAIEYDSDLIPALKMEFDQLDNVAVVSGDIRNFDLRNLPSSYKVVANIPYYLTSYLVKLFLQAESKPMLMVLLVQKEVAERLCANPGDMSVLAVSAQLYSDVEYVATVPASSFRPPPKVDSAIVKLVVRDKPMFDIDDKAFFRLVKAGFGEKRKMLRNSLSGGLGLEQAKVDDLLAKTELPNTARAQELSLEQWYKLYKQLN